LPIISQQFVLVNPFFEIFLTFLKMFFPGLTFRKKSAFLLDTGAVWLYNKDEIYISTTACLLRAKKGVHLL
jgi:hypothetical protein